MNAMKINKNPLLLAVLIILGNIHVAKSMQVEIEYPEDGVNDNAFGIINQQPLIQPPAQQMSLLEKMKQRTRRISTYIENRAISGDGQRLSKYFWGIFSFIHAMQFLPFYNLIILNQILNYDQVHYGEDLMSNAQIAIFQSVYCISVLTSIFTIILTWAIHMIDVSKPAFQFVRNRRYLAGTGSGYFILLQAIQTVVFVMFVYLAFVAKNTIVAFFSFGFLWIGTTCAHIIFDFYARD